MGKHIHTTKEYFKWSGFWKWNSDPWNKNVSNCSISIYIFFYKEFSAEKDLMAVDMYKSVNGYRKWI